MREVVIRSRSIQRRSVGEESGYSGTAALSGSKETYVAPIGKCEGAVVLMSGAEYRPSWCVCGTGDGEWVTDNV